MTDPFFSLFSSEHATRCLININQSDFCQKIRKKHEFRFLFTLIGPPCVLFSVPGPCMVAETGAILAAESRDSKIMIQAATIRKPGRNWIHISCCCCCCCFYCCWCCRDNTAKQYCVRSLIIGSWIQESADDYSQKLPVPLYLDSCWTVDKSPRLMLPFSHCYNFICQPKVILRQVLLLLLLEL